MSDRKKPSVVFYATVVAAVLMVYPLSFGPVDECQNTFGVTWRG